MWKTLEQHFRHEVHLPRVLFFLRLPRNSLHIQLKQSYVCVFGWPEYIVSIGLQVKSEYTREAAISSNPNCGAILQSQGELFVIFDLYLALSGSTTFCRESSEGMTKRKYLSV